jgi:hypothetical protein
LLKSLRGSILFAARIYQGVQPTSYTLVRKSSASEKCLFALY